jgi:hypothetical protein
MAGTAFPDVQFPGQPVDENGGDLAGPTATYLQELSLLETPDDVARGVSFVHGTPDSLQVISAGALSVTKIVSSIVATGGVGAVVAAMVRAFTASDVPVQVAFVAAAAVILASTIIALAVIVKSDVSGRAATTVAAYQARAQVAQQFMASTTKAM